MAKLVQINGIYYIIKNDGTPVRLRSGRNGPSSENSDTYVIEAFARKDGFDDSPISSATFIVHN